MPRTHLPYPPEFRTEALKLVREGRRTMVSSSGYYVWLGRGPSKRDRDDAALTGLIKRIHRESRGTYGAPRIWPSPGWSTASRHGEAGGKAHAALWHFRRHQAPWSRYGAMQCIPYAPAGPFEPRASCRGGGPTMDHPGRPPARGSRHRPDRNAGHTPRDVHLPAWDS